MRAYKLKKLKRIHGLHFTPDGARLLAVGGAEVRMVDAAVWLDLATGANDRRIELMAECYAVDPGLTRYVLGGADNGAGTAAVQWTELDGAADDWQTFRWEKRNLPPRYENVDGLAFDPTGARLAVSHTRPSGRRSNPNQLVPRLSIVDRDTGEVRVELPTETDSCMMSFSADGSRLVATGGIDGDARVTVFDVTAQQKLFTFDPPFAITLRAQLLPDNRVVVANRRDVHVLPANGGEPQFTLCGHPKQVNAVALTPDGRRLLTASHDGSIRTWDANTGASGAAFDWKIGAITALAFAPDGLTCAAAGANGSVVVWDVDA